MPRNPDPNFVFQASRLEHHLQRHFPGTEVLIVGPGPPAKFAAELNIVHGNKIIVRMPLEHVGRGKDPVIRTGVDLRVASMDMEFIKKITIALKKAHEEMQG